MNLVITTVLYERPAYAASAWQTGSPEHINHLSIARALKASHHIIVRVTVTYFHNWSYHLGTGREGVQGNNTSTGISLFSPIRLILFLSLDSLSQFQASKTVFDKPTPVQAAACKRLPTEKLLVKIKTKQSAIRILSGLGCSGLN